MKLEDPKASLESNLEINFGIYTASKCKTRLFFMFYHLLPRITMGKTYSILLLLCSFLQLLTSTVSVLEATDPILGNLKYIRIYPLIEYMDSKIIYLVAIYSTSLCVIIYVLLILLTALFPKGFSEHYSGGLLLPFYWLGIIPITELYVSFFNCESGYHYVVHTMECWNTFYIVHVVFVIIMLIIWSIVVIVIVFVSTYSHPYNDNPFSHFIWNFEVIYTIIRIAFVISAFLFDEDNLITTYAIWILSYITSIYFASLLLHVFPYYNCTISWLFAGCILTFIISTLWGSLLCVTEGIFDIKEYTNAIFLAMTIVICFPFAKLIRGRLLRGLMTTRKIKTAKELDMQVYMFLMGIVLKDQPTGLSDSFLSGYLCFFKQTCRDEKCPLFSPKTLEIDKVFCDDSCEEKKANIRNGSLRNFARYLLDNESNKEIYCASLSLQLARIYAYALGNLHQACLKILETEEMEPGILLQFALFCFKQDIINYLNNLEMSDKKRGRKSFYDVLAHELLLNEFLELLKNSTRIRNKFYTELKNMPNLNKLHKLGFKIMKLNTKIRAVWEQLKAIYPFHRPSLMIYKNYLCLVIGNLEEAAIVQLSLNKALWEHSIAKELSNQQIFSENSTSIIMGGEKHNVGKILMASNSSEQLFGYTPKTLLNKNVMILIPYLLRQKHNEILQHYFIATTDRIKGNSFPSFGLHRNGYIFPVRIAKQQVYSLKVGILYVGNVSLDSNISGLNYILTDVEGKIAGVTKKIGEILQITPSMIIEQHMNIKDYFSELEDLSTLEGNCKLSFTGSKNTLDTVQYRVLSINQEDEFKDSPLITPKSTGLKQFMKCQIQTLSYPQINYNMKLFQFPSIKAGNESKTIDYCKNTTANISATILPFRKANKIASENATKIITEEISANGTNELEQPHILYNNDDEKSSKGRLRRNSKMIIKEDESMNVSQSVIVDQKSVQENSSIAQNVTADPLKLRESLYKSQLTNLKIMNASQMSILSLKLAKQNIKFSDLTNQPYNTFQPKSITKLSWLLYIFMLLIFVIVLSRLILGVLLNKRFGNLGDVILLNVRKFCVIGNIAKMAELMLVYNIDDSPLDISFHDTYFDYSLLLKSESRKGINTYEDFIIQQSRDGLNILTADKIEMAEKMESLSEKYKEMIEPESITIYYHSYTGEDVAYTNSITYITIALIAHTLKAIEILEKNEIINSEGFNEDFILNNTYGTITNLVRSFYVGIDLNWDDIRSIQDIVCLVLIICLAVIVTGSVVILFIFLSLVSKELSSMLLMLTRISKTQLKEQLYDQMKFLRIAAAKNIEEQLLSLKDAEELPEIDEETTIKQLSPSHRNRKGTKVRDYIPHKNNKWIITFIVTIICGAIVGTYVVCDYIGKGLTNTVEDKTYETYLLVRNTHYNSYVLAYIYKYILSGKEGMCGTITCVDILTNITKYYSDNINELLTLHKQKKNIMSDKYLILFDNIIEGNTCNSIEYFKDIEQCKTFMGGLFEHGVYAATNIFIEQGTAVYMDFMKTEDESEAVRKYLNDKRLLDIEIMAELILNPAFDILSNELISDIKDMINNNMYVEIVIIIVFIIISILLTILGKVILLEKLRRVMYDVKVLLSNLPPKLIASTDDIVQYFVDDHITNYKH